MKKNYLLLRENKESGPYSFEEISSAGFHHGDLVWIEGESTRWQLVEEIEHLKCFIDCSFNNSSSQERTYNCEIEKFFPPQINEAVSTISFSTVKEDNRRQEKAKPVWPHKSVSTYGLAGVAAIVIGVMFGATVIKKLADDYLSGEVEQKIAALPFIEHHPQKEASEDFKSTLLTEIVPVYKSSASKDSKKENDSKVEKQIKVKAGKYKVGLFGGINGFQLTVFNTSSQYIDKALVSVDYLRPNGVVIESENILFSSIKPKEAQTISIPGSKRGVTVKYKILKVFSHDYKPELKHI